MKTSPESESIYTTEKMMTYAAIGITAACFGCIYYPKAGLIYFFVAMPHMLAPKNTPKYTQALRFAMWLALMMFAILASSYASDWILNRSH